VVGREADLAEVTSDLKGLGHVRLRKRRGGADETKALARRGGMRIDEVRRREESTSVLTLLLRVESSVDGVGLERGWG
jgi:hypothetical protein